MSMQKNYTGIAFDLTQEAEDLEKLCPILVDKIIRSCITFKPFPKVPDFITKVFVQFSRPYDFKVMILTENIILTIDKLDMYSLRLTSSKELAEIEINNSKRPDDYAWAIIRKLETGQVEELKHKCDCNDPQELTARVLAGERVACMGATRILRHMNLLSLKFIGHSYLGFYTRYESLFFSATLRRCFHKLFRKKHKVQIW